MRRTIKSYVLRAGRTSTRQQRGLETGLDSFGLVQDGKLWNPEAAFGRKAPLIVEVGFGMGASLLETARTQPECDFLGIEVHRPGIGSLIAGLQDGQIGNVRIAPFDATEVFTHYLADASLAGVQIFFPDPWPKKRHHKRRLVQAPFIDLVVRKLAPGGVLHVATDWEPYAEAILALLDETPGLRNLAAGGAFHAGDKTRPDTKFEARGLRLGHVVRDLRFERV